MPEELTEQELEWGRQRVAIKLEALEYKAQHKREFPPEWYDWQQEFVVEGASNSTVWLLAANQIGKTQIGGHTTAVHMTGDYPDDWAGYRYQCGGLRVWLAGVDGAELKNVLQLHMFGTLQDNGEFTGGWIHPDEIGKVVRSRSVQGLAEEIEVKHQSGGTTRVRLFSYSQVNTGTDSLPMAGEVVDLVYGDEQPPDKIMGQLAVRTVNGDGGKGGRSYFTLTPELGMTESLRAIMEEPGIGQKRIGPVGWDRAPHITPEKREVMLAKIPVAEQEMRTKGVPYFGSGLVFPVSENRIICDPFELPGWCTVIRAMDFGADHPTASVWLAYDPEIDTIYLTKVYRKSLKWADGISPVPTHVSAMNSKWKHAPMVYPHDGDNETAAGEAMAAQYQNEGIEGLMPFTNPTLDGKRNIRVEPGITLMLTDMQSEKFKVFSTCALFFEEMRSYHRKDGKIVKVADDIMSAARYGHVMIRDHGVPIKGFDNFQTAKYHGNL